VAHPVVGVCLDGFAARGDGALEDRRRLGIPAAIQQILPQGFQMPTARGPPVHEVAEDRLGLGTAAHAIEQLSQLERRLGT
jgi:hypothetical protein